jgi:hypothetical protein
MRNRIFGAIGVLWGGYVIFNRLTGAWSPQGEGGYRTGQNLGFGMMVLMFLVGLYYLAVGDGPPPWKKQKKTKARSAFRTPTPPPDF